MSTRTELNLQQGTLSSFRSRLLQCNVYHTQKRSLWPPMDWMIKFQSWMKLDSLYDWAPAKIKVNVLTLATFDVSKSGKGSSGNNSKAHGYFEPRYAATTGLAFGCCNLTHVRLLENNKNVFTDVASNIVICHRTLRRRSQHCQFPITYTVILEQCPCANLPLIFEAIQGLLSLSQFRLHSRSGSPHPSASHIRDFVHLPAQSRTRKLKFCCNVVPHFLIHR